MLQFFRACMRLIIVGIALTLGGLTARAAPLAEPLYQTPAADLMTPAIGHLYEIPVVSICYLPTRDGVRLDPKATDLDATLFEVYAKVEMLNRQIKFALEEGSRYHGYVNRNAPPTLGYKIVAMITLNEDLPRDPIEKKGKTGQYQIDYNKILERFGGRDWVDKEGVKEFWIWGYHYGDLDVTESNMSSPLSGNVSNSYRREGDMPVYNHSYIAYNYNYERSAAEAIHDHGHQLEAQLAWVNQKQDGNTKLFWEQFVGKPDAKTSFAGTLRLDTLSGQYRQGLRLSQSQSRRERHRGLETRWQRTKNAGERPDVGRNSLRMARRHRARTADRGALVYLLAPEHSGRKQRHQRGWRSADQLVGFRGRLGRRRATQSRIARRAAQVAAVKSDIGGERERLDLLHQCQRIHALVTGIHACIYSLRSLFTALSTKRDGAETSTAPTPPRRRC